MSCQRVPCARFINAGCFSCHIVGECIICHEHNLLDENAMCPSCAASTQEICAMVCAAFTCPCCHALWQPGPDGRPPTTCPKCHATAVDGP